MTRNRKNLNDQRDYEYQDQDRNHTELAAFEDIDDPTSDVEYYISEGNFCHGDDWRSVDSDETTPQGKNRYKRSSDHKNRDYKGSPDHKTRDDHFMAKKNWVDSWCHEDKKLAECVADGDEMIISIDGYFRKNRKAGYGVIIRNRYTGVPFLASTAVYEQGKPISSLYHELQGLNKGLELAIKYALRDIFIVQLSRCFVPDIARWYSSCTARDDGHASTPNTFCNTCARGYYFKDCTDEDYDLHIYPLILEIRDKFAMLESSFVCSYGFVMNKYNKAADYLAKLQVNKEEMEPHEFPEELKDILYEESLEGDLMSAIRESGYGTDEEILFCY